MFMGLKQLLTGFDTRRTMVEGSKAQMDEIGIKFLFAATEANDDTKLHITMQFPSMYAAKMNSTNEEVAEKDEMPTNTLNGQSKFLARTGVHQPNRRELLLHTIVPDRKHSVILQFCPNQLHISKNPNSRSLYITE